MIQIVIIWTFTVSYFSIIRQFYVQCTYDELMKVTVVFSMQLDDSREEETVTKTDETPQIIDEFELKLADDDMVIDESNEGDEAECILEDFVLIDSEDGNEEGAVSTADTDNDDAKPSGINILLIIFYVSPISIQPIA